MSHRIKAGVIGPGNIGTDLLIKLHRSSVIEPVLMIGIYEDSSGLDRARQLGIETSTRGVDAVVERDDIPLVFEATSAKAHRLNAPRLGEAGKRVVDLTPAALGPYVVPPVNLTDQLDAPNINMVTCGGQATIPIVHAIDRAGDVSYAEIVATIASASAGPGTRQNIDEFTVTTARAIESVGGADTAKAIIILNPADPPILMRDTIYGCVRKPDAELIEKSIRDMIAEIQTYVPGYRLVLFDIDDDRVTVMVEVEGAGDHLAPYSGNLDIMTAAAARAGEVVATQLMRAEAPA